MYDIQKRKGKVKISKYSLDNLDKVLLKKVFSNFYPIHIEYECNQDINDIIIYYGYSSYFDILDNGCVIPEYKLIIHSKLGKNDNLIYRLEFKKEDKDVIQE